MKTLTSHSVTLRHDDTLKGLSLPFPLHLTSLVLTAACPPQTLLIVSSRSVPSSHFSLALISDTDKAAYGTGLVPLLPRRRERSGEYNFCKEGNRYHRNENYHCFNIYFKHLFRQKISLFFFICGFHFAFASFFFILALALKGKSSDKSCMICHYFPA